MAKTSKKALGAAMAGVMAVGAVAGVVSSVDQVKVANAAESQASKNAKAKIAHLTWSVKNNYLGIKNQAQWEVYIKEAKALIAKMPSAEKTGASSLTVVVNKIDTLVKAVARINQVEKSMETNFHGIKNANQWNAYLDLAAADLLKVDQVEFADQIAELYERGNACDEIIVKIEAEFKVDYDAAVALYNEAKTAGDITKAEAALVAAEDLGTCPESDQLEKDVKALIEEIKNAVAAVSSVEAVNAKELVVKFSKVVDETKVAAAVKLDGITFALNEESKDGKTFTLTATNKLIDVKDAVLTIDPVETKADATVKTAKYVSLFSYKDTVAPTTVKVEAKDKKAVITFNEEIQAGATVSVNGYNHSDITISGKTLTINTLEDEKTYSVEVVGAKDSANNVANPISLNFTVSKADAATEQTVTTSASENKVTFKFANALSPSNKAKVVFTNGKALNTDASALELDGVAKDGVVYSDDKKTVVVDTQELEVLGTLNFLNTEVKITDAGLKDTVKVNVNLSSDKTAAKLVSSETSANGDVTLEFNEEVKVPASGKLTLKVTSIDGIYQSIAKDWTDCAVAYAKDKDGKDIKTKLAVTVGAKADVKKNYTVEVPAGIQDVYANASEKFTISVVKPETDSTVKPEAKITVTATPSKNVIKLTFAGISKEITAAATNASNYTLGGKALPTGTVVRYVDDKANVEIVLPEGSIVTTGSYVLTMKNIQDEIGNTLEAGQESKLVSLVENVTPKASSLVVTSSESAVITFSEAVAHDDVDSDTKISGVTVKVNGKEIAGATLTLGSKTLTVGGLELKANDTVTVEFKNAEIVDSSTNKNQIKDATINN